MSESVEPIKTFTDIHRVLKNYIPPLRSDEGAYTLERMQQLMDFLGNPQNTYNVIHVAGTSGKTSTSYYIASLLKQAGHKTGLSVSPHVDEVNERVQIDIKPLPEGRYCNEFAIFINQVDKSNIKPTYFELLTAFAFWEYRRMDCEYVVSEVGLGGLLDATNVVTTTNKLNVITDIGLDHQEVLGKTISLIASQKAGIIKPHNKVVCYEQDDEIMDVIREIAAGQQAELHEIWPVKNSDLPRSLPLFQRRNWYLAYSTYIILAARDGLPELNETQLAMTTAVSIPARMERYEINNKTIILDGSHNQQKLKALVKSIKHAYPAKKFTILISFASTKLSRITQCIETILPIADKLLITSFSTTDHVKMSVDPLKIVAVCDSLGFDNWEVINDPVKAFRKLRTSPGYYKLVTGSFYLLNHIRPLKVS